jgi:hypothetical protein
VLVGVFVGVGVAVFVGDGVNVGVLVGVLVGVAVGVFVGVFVGVIVGVTVGVFVAVGVGLLVGVFEGVTDGEIAGVAVGRPVQSRLLAWIELTSNPSASIFKLAGFQISVRRTYLTLLNPVPAISIFVTPDPLNLLVAKVLSVIQFVLSSLTSTLADSVGYVDLPFELSKIRKSQPLIFFTAPENL